MSDNFDHFYSGGPTSASFAVVVDGKTLGRFQAVSGLSVETEVKEVIEGGQNGFVHKLPGRMSWPNLVLKRGVTANDGLIQWLLETSGEGLEGGNHKVTRRTMAVKLFSASGTLLRSWNFVGAFPVKWTGPDFTLSSDDFLIEELEIAHHGFTVGSGT